MPATTSPCTKSNSRLRFQIRVCGNEKTCLARKHARRCIVEPGTEQLWLRKTQANLCASVQSLNKQTRAAVLTFEAKDEPDIVGRTLAYLSPYWRAFNVWMVLDPNWGWVRREFQGVDAIAEDYEAKDVSIVGGREVRIWTKLEPVEGGRGLSRYYPAQDQTSPPSSEVRRISGGWGHEHCELCKAHIDARQFGYCDPGEHWMCEKCYERYVIQRDLAFVDEL